MHALAQYRQFLRGDEHRTYNGITYGHIAHMLDMPRAESRPRQVLNEWRKRVDSLTPTEAVMTMHIVEPSYVKLGWRHKPEPTRPLAWKLSRRTLYMVRWAERIHWPTEPLVSPERDRAWRRQAESEVLDIALRRLRRLAKERKRVRRLPKDLDAARKREARAALKARIAAMSNEQANMRQVLTARAFANGSLTND